MMTRHIQLAKISFLLLRAKRHRFGALENRLGTNPDLKELSFTTIRDFRRKRARRGRSTTSAAVFEVLSDCDGSSASWYLGGAAQAPCCWSLAGLVVSWRLCSTNFSDAFVSWRFQTNANDH